MGHSARHRDRRRRGVVGTGDRTAIEMAAVDVDHVGDGLRVGFRPGNDRRLAARVRRTVDRQARIPSSGAVGHRCRRGSTHVLQPHSGLPAQLVDYARLRSPSRCAADIRLARSHRSARRRLGRIVLPADRIQCRGRDHHRNPSAVQREDRATGGSVRGGGANGDLGGRLGGRLLRGCRRLGYRTARPCGTGDGAPTGVGGGRRRIAARLGNIPQLRPGADGDPGARGIAVRSRPPHGDTHTSGGGRCGTTGGGGVRCRRLLVV